MPRGGGETPRGTFPDESAVQAIHLKDGAVRAVVANQGAILTEIVVNAAGQWAQEGNRENGRVELPDCLRSRTCLITEKVEGVTPDLPTVHDPNL